MTILDSEVHTSSMKSRKDENQPVGMLPAGGLQGQVNTAFHH